MLRSDLGFIPVLLTLVIVVLYFTIASGGIFLKPENLSNLLGGQIGTIGVLGLGSILVLLLDKIDLSVASIAVPLLYNKSSKKTEQIGGQKPMLISYLYGLLYKSASVFFNLLNRLLFGNLPPFGSVVVIMEDHGRFLVLKRGRKYTFPGGFMRWREHPTQTARREVYEETGLHVKIRDFIGYHSVGSGSVTKMSTLILVFRGEVSGGELRRGLEGQPVWLDEAEVQNNLASHYTRLLAQYVAAREKACSKKDRLEYRLEDMHDRQDSSG